MCLLFVWSSLVGEGGLAKRGECGLHDCPHDTDVIILILRKLMYASLCVLERFIPLGRLALVCWCNSYRLQHAPVELG